MARSGENFRVIFFDFGDTLIRQEVDSETTLDNLDLKLLPQVNEILEYASRHFELGLITNTETSDEAAIWRCLQKLGTDKHFKTITTSIDVGAKKPDKKIFLTALSKHNAEPKSVIMVGNNYGEDIIPAKQLGMTTVYLRQHRDSGNQFFESADYVVESTDELLQFFRDKGATVNLLQQKLEKAKVAELQDDWQKASLCFSQAAGEAAKQGDYGQASELYMKAAVCSERAEEWRNIGLLWLKVAAALRGESDPIGKGRYIDADAAKHNFPTIDLSYWKSLPREERLGRALRNAGYHLEKAGTNQSAYKQYEMSGSVFKKAGLWDEASRSFMLAARSYISQHGEIDLKLLKDLEETLKELYLQDRGRYLKRLVLYYRHLHVDLASQGNIEQANELYIYQCNAKREIFGLEKKRLSQLIFRLWKVTSLYGTSFKRWLTVGLVIAFVIFPPAYLLLMSFPENSGWNERLATVFMQSINALLGKENISLSYSWPLNLTIFLEMSCGYIMLGSLATMIITRITK
jgi:phosphoglycolate phosphatase-like HAD superfamily hydrolase